MFHIYNGLNKASTVMQETEKKDFLKYINSKTQYIPFSIFILKRKSSKIYVLILLTGFLNAKIYSIKKS